MYHLFSYNRDEFAKHFHKAIQRRNGPRVIKAKFGDTPSSKTARLELDVDPVFTTGTRDEAAAA